MHHNQVIMYKNFCHPEHYSPQITGERKGGAKDTSLLILKQRRDASLRSERQRTY